MYTIQTMDRISPKGLEILPREKFEIASEMTNPDAILIRSKKILDMELPDNLKAIARAGAGVNNIPIDRCSEKGIVVFNTPGANANSVKELALAGLLLSSRKIFEAMTWAKTLIGKGDEVPKLIEDGKSQFIGQEIKGKKLGIIGLGAIGVMVANDAQALGMDVSGFDPFISLESAWKLSRAVKHALSFDTLLAESDYLTLHIPLDEKTKGILNKEKFNLMKKGVRIMNFSRGGLVNNADLKEAIAKGIVASYVTDFPDEELLSTPNVLCIPHLGASTPEAEDNCAIMACQQIYDFLTTGNIRNSVNFPNCEMDFNSTERLIVANKNIPNMVGQITTLLASENVNIREMINRPKDGYAYNIINVDQEVSASSLEKIKAIDGVLMVRLIKHS
ncbi:MAG TPA: phosphoglycerate dehydrogenase [Spirochaetia bacterium]|nr:phosphoglycerate dehydrogenase [Spirochaetia bacterium]